MILVRNRLPRLSGNKINFALFCALLFLVTSCGVKKKTSTTVLKSPDYEEVEDKRKEEEARRKEEEERARLKEEELEKDLIIDNKIALLLPFQLQKINFHNLSKEDVRRSYVALDFYQGLEIGLKEIADKDHRFLLDVLDTQDDVGQNHLLASAIETEEASLIMGPIFPNEIKSFGSSKENKKTLQVNPLAASLPSEFNLENLVSLTPSIEVHAQGLAKKIDSNTKKEEWIILLNVGDNRSKQFIHHVRNYLESSSKNKNQIKVVNKVDDLKDYLDEYEKNHVVCGSTDNFVINMVLSTLEDQFAKENKDIQLYGHPNWSKVNFHAYDFFASFNPIITSDSHLDEDASKARAFARQYKETYGIEPSEISYKGYDAALYFGDLIKKYGKDIEEKLLKNNYKGIYSDYSFNYNQSWGYENTYVNYLQYRNGSFK